MKIVQIAALEEPIPPEKYGGTELIVYNLVEEMVKLGHEVYLLASGDSKTSGTLVPIIPESIRKMWTGKKEDSYAWKSFLKIFYIQDILQKIEEIQPDVVHNHYDWRFIQFAKLLKQPMMSTCHKPLYSKEQEFVFRNMPNAGYVSISDNQRKHMIAEMQWLGTVYNGIQVERFEVGPVDNRDYFAFLGRTSPEKGLRELCEMILKTDQKLKIAAKVDVADREYFEQEIKPLIDGEQIEFLGEVDHEGKVELLKHAKGLLLWLNWEEPFGLVVVEAMACGTPVLVNPRGSMPEIIIDGKTGFLVKSLDEMRNRLSDATKLSAMDCRQHVEANFSSQKMAKGYLDLAEKLLA